MVAAFKGTLREIWSTFSDNSGTDIAAALTYYGVMSVFPALLAVVGSLGVFGEGDAAVELVLDTLQPLVAASTLETIEPTIRGLAFSRGAGIGLAIGIVGAVWSASAYVGAFGRAVHRIASVEETRPFWKLRLQQFAATLVAVVLGVVLMAAFMLSGSLARSLGAAVGLADTAVSIWSVAKWPLAGLALVALVSLLYSAVPDVRFRVLSKGAAIALALAAMLSFGLAFYVSNFGSYDRTYGSIAGVIIGLLWLWLVNISLLLGVAIDTVTVRLSGAPVAQSAEAADLKSAQSGFESQPGHD